MSPIKLLSAGIVVGIFLIGCTAQQAIQEIKPTSFLTHPERLQKPKYTPFDLAWSSPLLESREYYLLVVAAVRTDRLRTSNWVFRAGTLIPTRDLYLQKVDELADYIQKTVSKHFDEYDKKDSDVVVAEGAPVDPVNPKDTSPVAGLGAVIAQKTLKVEISITEANFGDPVIYGGLLAVPVPGVANLSTAAKSPSLTLEARLVDEESGEIVTELADRRFPQVKIIDLNRLTISSALNELADSFAENLVESFYRKKGEKVGKRSPFSLLPW